MQGTFKAADAAKSSGEGKDRVRSRPTVTNSGQVMWSTRDLLFPAGHPASSIPPPAKK
jgi:hypothetical protein